MKRLGCAIALLVAGVARADHVYMREADAPRALFPESTGYETKSVELTDVELKALADLLGKRVDIRHYPYLEVRRNEAILGDIFLLDVVGQARPISFAVAVTPDGALRDVQVLVYRETQGDAIREARFRRQFAGKRLDDPVALGKDIDAISGATISSRAAAYAAKKALGLAALLRHRAVR